MFSSNLFTLLIIISFFIALIQSKSTIYGNYCGLNHYNEYGIEPTDEMDRICQIHDICVSALNMNSCFCNEQLYSKLSLYTPTESQYNEWNSDLNLIFDSLALICHINERYLDNVYYIGNKDKGFTYLPVYGYSKEIIKVVFYMAGVNVKLYITHKDTYTKEFTQLAYQYPSNTYEYLDNNKYKELNASTTGYISVYPDEVLIFINYDSSSNSYISIDENNEVINTVFTYIQEKYFELESEVNYLNEENKNLINSQTRINETTKNLQIQLDNSNNQNEVLTHKLNIMLIVMYVVSGLISLSIFVFTIVKLIKHYKNKEIKFTNIQDTQELSSVNINL